MSELSHKEKGDLMIQWAEKVKLPAEIQLSPWEKIVDPKKYLSTQIQTMQAYPVTSPFYAQAYMRLYKLKEFLTNKRKAK